MYEHYLDIINNTTQGLIINNNPIVVRDEVEIYAISLEIFSNKNYLEIATMTTDEIIETFFFKKGYFDISYFLQYTEKPREDIAKIVIEIILNLDLNLYNTNELINMQNIEKSNIMELTNNSSLDTSITANTTETSVNNFIEQLSMSNFNVETLEFTPTILESFFAPTVTQMFYDLFVFFVVVCSDFILKIFTDHAISTSIFELIKSLFN